jgi:hypothetical protein
VNRHDKIAVNFASAVAPADAQLFAKGDRKAAWKFLQRLSKTEPFRDLAVLTETASGSPNSPASSD